MKRQQTLGSVVSYMAYFYLLRKISATSVSAVFLATPVIAVALGWLINGERYSLNALLGIAIILVGLALFSYLGLSTLKGTVPAKTGY